MPRQRTSIAPIVATADGEKQCTMCGLVLKCNEFGRNARNKDGLQMQCKCCRSNMQLNEPGRISYMKTYRRINRPKINECMEEYKLKNPQKVRARKLLNQNIYRGKLARPSRCSVCDRTGFIEAHHPDHSRPLDVVWVCKQCHIALEKTHAFQG